MHISFIFFIILLLLIFFIGFSNGRLFEQHKQPKRIIALGEFAVAKWEWEKHAESFPDARFVRMMDAADKLIDEWEGIVYKKMSELKCTRPCAEPLPPTVNEGG